MRSWLGGLNKHCSFMSGRLPDTTKVWEFKDSFRNQGDGNSWTTLPGWFKRHGYITLGSGVSMVDFGCVATRQCVESKATVMGRIKD